MRIYRFRKRHRHAAPELNITAFMNLMVILVPFLLITAVFSRLTILHLNLPEDLSAASDQPPSLDLQVQIRKDRLVVADGRGGLIKQIPNLQGGHDTKALSTLLQEVKARFPDVTTANVLAEDDTSYDTLVQVMDAVRSFRVQRDGNWIHAELFPDIAIGDAPTAGGRR